MRFLLTLSCHLPPVYLLFIVFTYVYQTIKPLHKTTSILSPLNYLFCIPCHCLVWGQNLMVLSIICLPRTRKLQARSFCTQYLLILKTLFPPNEDWLSNIPWRRRRTPHRNEFFIILLDWRPSYFCWFLIR